MLNEKALREGDYLIIFYILVDNKNKIFFYTIINNDITRYTFIDEDYVRCRNLSLYKLKESRGLEVFDKRLTMSENISHVTKV